jgi:hypothetical protein
MIAAGIFISVALKRSDFTQQLFGENHAAKTQKTSHGKVRNC